MAEHMWKNILEEEEVDTERLKVLDAILQPQTQRQVEAGVELTKYVKQDGVNPDNYPLLLELLRNGNHSIVEAMVGDSDPNLLFLGLESNPYIIRTFFEIMYAHAPGELHPQVFEVALGVLLSTYRDPKVGLRKYALSEEELNAIAKNLDESRSQEEAPNRQILDFLGDLGDMVLEGLSEQEQYEELVNHAIDLRNAFMDPNQSLREQIPELLVERGQYGQGQLRPRGTRTPEGGESEENI
jgi:hypothetical protein